MTTRHTAWLAALALSLTWTAQAAVPDAPESRLPSGVTVVTRVERSVPLCSFRAVVRAGSRYDPPGGEGTASLVSDTLLLGAGARSEKQLDQDLERHGAVLDAAVSAEALVIVGDVPTVNAGALPAALEILGDVLVAPTFPAEAVGRARDRAVGGLKSLVDDRMALAERAFAAAVFQGHPYARPGAGTLASVGALGPDALRAFHQQWVRPSRTWLGFAGDCDTKVIQAALKKRLSGWKPAGAEPVEPELPPVPPAAARLVLVDTGDPSLTQAQIRLGLPLRRTFGDPQYLAYHVSAEVLGGDFSARLNDALRVKAGLTYGAKWIYQLDDQVSRAGYVWTFAGLRDAARAADLAFDTVATFQKDSAGAEELTRVKSRLVRAFPFRFETGGAILGELSQLWLDHRGRDVLESYPARVQALDAAALDAVDADFDLAQATLVVVANDSARHELEALAQRRGLAFSTLDYGALGLR